MLFSSSVLIYAHLVRKMCTGPSDYYNLDIPEELNESALINQTCLTTPPILDSCSYL